MPEFRLICGDALDVLKGMESESVQCVVTSPPYWGLRDYGVVGQIGLEPTPELYVAHIIEVFREVRRVLADDGTLWLNLGDSYAGNSGGGFRPGCGRADGLVDDRNQRNRNGNGCPEGLKPKDLMMIPARVAIALQEPYIVPCVVATETDRAWLAAMFDGEGCIGIRRFDSYSERTGTTWNDGFVVYTTIGNNDLSLLEKCISITGRGACKLKCAAGTSDKRGIFSKRDNFGWRLDGNPAVDIIRAIWPYLIAKRKQAAIAYTLDQINKSARTSKGEPVSPAIQEKKKLCWELIKKCNQRESVDLPSWIEEPKEQIEPGWYLRSEIVWHKPNPMPESVTDRVTKAHEMLYLLSKSAKYFYDAEAIQEPFVGTTLHDRTGPGADAPGQRPQNGNRGPASYNGSTFTHGKTAAVKPTVGTGPREEAAGRNKRSVWTVATEPFPDAHFAVMPTALVDPCVLAGSAQGDTCLDPFSGACTTGVVALRRNRNFIGIELNPAYVEMGRRRLLSVAPLFVSDTQPPVSCGNSDKDQLSFLDDLQTEVSDVP